MTRGDYILACFDCHYKRLSSKKRVKCPKCKKVMKVLGQSKE
jgi:Zn finger protein HypA/HybF involved in hydrogenase expression